MCRSKYYSGEKVPSLVGESYRAGRMGRSRLVHDTDACVALRYETGGEDTGRMKGDESSL